MLISPLIPLSPEIITGFKSLNEINLRHLFWHAFQVDSKIWEGEEFAFCLKQQGIFRKKNGEYEKIVSLMVMGMGMTSKDLNHVCPTPTLNLMIKNQCNAISILNSIFPKESMKILHISELRHPVYSGFYSLDEYESFFKNIAYDCKKMIIVKVHHS